MTKFILLDSRSHESKKLELFQVNEEYNGQLQVEYLVQYRNIRFTAIWFLTYENARMYFDNSIKRNFK